MRTGIANMAKGEPMDDLISRRAAIDAIEHITSSMSVCVNTDECHGMKRMQRQAVIELANLPSAQPNLQPTCNQLATDCIGRQAAIEAAEKESQVDGAYGYMDTKSIVDLLNGLPSAQPERKKGKWIRHTDWEYDGECAYECSVCGMGSDVDYDFCMRCGADMRGEKDE